MSTPSKEFVAFIQERMKDTSKRGALRDLLTDIMHACEDEIDFDLLLRDAEEVFDEEKVLGCPCGEEIPPGETDQHIAQCDGKPKDTE